MAKDKDLIHLLDYAIELSGDSDIGRDLPDTEWNVKGFATCHEWRSYVHPMIVACWENLGIDAMLSVFIMAYTLADNEEWE